MARQTKEEKIVFRIRNLHFKVFLHGICGISILTEVLSVATYSREEYTNLCFVGESSRWWLFCII
jgi:hypothetical protein